jgi:hypothetical protein
MFQMTTSLSHDLKLPGLNEMLAALKDSHLQQFFVVVPEMFFHKFTTTPLKPVGSTLPPTVQQFVLALPLPKSSQVPEGVEVGASTCIREKCAYGTN